ncbi:hypothetical protein [Aliivibrio fischeri]|uniref:Uncharacterized protein n=1 Tax=Aliivibrio fischeri TaxID=668 RepID=A0A510UDB5_ALIFS|nr:hypothetical protein [Aliivibrio fischeri]GEK12557.1 hypothetical protein AFI02nite_05930 [Aliivibrio fischeri]
MMQRQEFISRMTIAYMEHYGSTPSAGNLSDWSALWATLTSEAGTAR